MIENHSYQCISLNQKSSLVNNELVYNWETYKNKCLNFLEENDNLKKSNVIDEFLKLYNETQYNFTFDRNKMLFYIKNGKKIALNFLNILYLKNKINSIKMEKFSCVIINFFMHIQKKIKNLFFVNMRSGWTNYQYLI